jgi:hypothetical protein
MNFKDLLIDSAIQAGLEVLKELGQQRKQPREPKPKKYRVKKKPEKK